MNDSLILIISVFTSLILGFFLGQLITGLKKKSEAARLQERLQLKEQQLTDFNKEKIELLKKQEQLQDDKEFFQNELTSRNVAFENLEHRISEKSA